MIIKNEKFVGNLIIGIWCTNHIETYHYYERKCGVLFYKHHNKSVYE